MFSRQASTHVVFLIFFFLPSFKEGSSQYCCTGRQVMKTAFGLITEAGTKSDEPIKSMLREPFLDEWKITV